MLMTFEAKSFEIHRWHSTEYVDTWMADQEREEGRRTLRIKLVSLLPFELEASVRILDLGTGGGALSREILSSFPKASIVCQDFSEVMLGHAKQHLVKFIDRVTFIHSDLSTPAWSKPILGTFDAVVSSLVMHTIPGRVRDIYGEIFRLIAPGGCFISVDNLAAPGPKLNSLYSNERLTTHQAKAKSETETVSIKDIDQETSRRRQTPNTSFPERVRNPLNDTLTTLNHLEWLRQAGFEEVDCLWKDLNQAIIGGFKQ
jgi:tRNA (cmo5U34)-methyltransferase